MGINKSLERLSEHDLHPDLMTKCLKVLMATVYYESPTIGVSDKEDEVEMKWGWVPDDKTVIASLYAQDYWDRLLLTTYTDEKSESLEIEQPRIHHIANAVAQIWT